MCQDLSWADLTNPEAKVSPDEILLLIQCALVLLGSASKAISLERKKIAWVGISSSLKGLATEDYEKREDQLFLGESLLRCKDPGKIFRPDTSQVEMGE